MANNSLSFPNFAGEYESSAMDAALLQRMFGDDVCSGTGQTPCALKPAARAFMERANDSMSGGRCEGFAVMSQLFAEDRLKPLDFGALTARELTLPENESLQREIAYWFTTQLVPEVSSKETKQYLAKDIMPALAEALQSDAKERWRIGIVRKKGKTISGGHALTPIGYYADPSEEKVYWLRVYDNNRPDAEHLLKIDVGNNRWEFEASENPDQVSRLYYGDETNENPLYLAPVLSRLGTLPCFFCNGDGETQVTTSGGAQVALDTPFGKLGVVDGKLFGLTVPGLSAPLDAELAQFITLLPKDTVLDMQVVFPGDADFPFATQQVKVAASDFFVAVKDLVVSATDRLSGRPGQRHHLHQPVAHQSQSQE